MKKTGAGDPPAEAPIAIETAGDPVAAPAEQLPSEGGAFIRLPDGTLQREEEG